MHNRPLARRWPVVSAQKQLQVKVLRSDRAERRRATPRDPLQVRKAHGVAPRRAARRKDRNSRNRRICHLRQKAIDVSGFGRRASVNRSRDGHRFI